jgi:hypothetical protein
MLLPTIYYYLIAAIANITNYIACIYNIYADSIAMLTTQLITKYNHPI